MNFLNRYPTKTSNIKFHEIRVVGAKLLHADGQTDTDKHDKPKSRFSQFCEGAQNG